MPMAACDVAVIGGGLVGSAIAYGLSRGGTDVTVLDEGDLAYRASRGNFGLVWVQSKGAGMPSYARWTRSSALLWPEFSRELAELSGIDVHYQRSGGLHLCFTEEDYLERQRKLSDIRNNSNGAFDFEMLAGKALRERLPIVSDEIYGASYCALDGHANPLLLLRALHASMEAQGVRYQPGQRVEQITAGSGEFRLRSGKHTVTCRRLVIAAGLGSVQLARFIGLSVPLRPNRGEILVTERLAPFVDFATAHMRQTESGTVMIGDSHEDVGFDDRTCTSVLSQIAERAVTAFPALRDVHVIRSWGALRVFSPDGFPVYHASERYPGAFVANCHSGVTLAAVHARRLAAWIGGGERPEEIIPFTTERFDVPTVT